jgi:pimeloyl-ACP methyl ester carboxylesterase
MACAAEIRSGDLRPGSEDPNGCVAYPLLMPRVLTEALKEKALESPLQYESQASFNRNGTRSSNLAINSDRDYGALPLIVLSAEWEPPWIFALMPASMTDDAKAGHANISRGHEALADLSSKGKLQLVANAGHYIQLDQPQVVIDAVSAVVEEARALQKVSGS